MFDIKKSYIDDNELDLEIKNEHFDQNKKINESFSYQDLKILPLSILK